MDDQTVNKKSSINKPINQPSRIRGILRPVEIFFDVFFSHGALHGITYLGKALLHLVEKVLWIVLIVISLYFCVTLSLESWERFLTKSTVVAIEKDHYYWNISLPSLTICPMERIDRELFDQFAARSFMLDDEKIEMFEFIESLANSTYMNFENIKGTANVDRILSMLRIAPKDYMILIANLTQDLTRRDDHELRVRSQNNLEYIRSDQTLTEYGICYTTNSFIARNLTTRFSITARTIQSISPDICHTAWKRTNLKRTRLKVLPVRTSEMKPPKPVCHYRTLKLCFPPLKELFLEFRGGPNHDSINCYCEQNCVDSKVIIERTQVLIGTRKLLGSNGGLVLMKKYPLIRFSRQVLFTFTDLLVSIGGTAGLFLGFSVLGVVEIVYFFTLRLVWYCLGHR
ncbi:uncharacterized protein LOC5573493 isoform X1 [Aedes aegypti]|uniref:Uncharacterized protein n=1 Tax=Aedes aegypti TaxID=7159 RepID=A0A903VEA6_AEDAE|nr:uncharacterized protein LOC5573493 isoform X1 [Aedes aegypti]